MHLEIDAQLPFVGAECPGCGLRQKLQVKINPVDGHHNETSAPVYAVSGTGVGRGVKLLQVRCKDCEKIFMVTATASVEIEARVFRLVPEDSP